AGDRAVFHHERLAGRREREGLDAGTAAGGGVPCNGRVRDRDASLRIESATSAALASTLALVVRDAAVVKIRIAGHVRAASPGGRAGGTRGRVVFDLCLAGTEARARTDENATPVGGARSGSGIVVLDDQASKDSVNIRLRVDAASSRGGATGCRVEADDACI